MSDHQHNHHPEHQAGENEQHVANNGATEAQDNPGKPMTDEEHRAKIAAKFDNTVEIRDFRYYFRKDDLGNKRPTVELKLPVLSIEGLVAILENADSPEVKKQLDLVMDALASVVDDQARSIVSDAEDINQENFPFDKISWEAIANMPKAERRGGGIGKETWEEFGKDYIAVMPNATGKTVDQVGLAAKLFLSKFNQIKTNKPVIKALQGQLGIYANTSPNAETYVACVEFLNNKAQTLLDADEAALLEML